MANQTTMQRIFLAPGSDLSFLHETPADWVPNSFSGLAQHQILVHTLIEFGWARGWTVELAKFPNDGWGDRGVDVILNGSPIDVKSTGLTQKTSQWKTRTIDSPAYAGKKRNPYSLTEWLVFGKPGSSIDTWEVALYKHMKPSKKLSAPYFWNGEVMPFTDLARILDSRNGRENQLDNWHNGSRVTAESRYY